MAGNKELDFWMQSISSTFAFIADSVMGAAAAFRLWGVTYAEVMAKMAMSVAHPIDYFFGGMKEAITTAADADRDAIMNSTHMFRDALDLRRTTLAEKAATELAEHKKSNEQFMGSVNYYAALREKGLMSEADYIKTVSAMLKQTYNPDPNYRSSGGTTTATKGARDDPRAGILAEHLQAISEAAAAEKNKYDDWAKVIDELHREGLTSDAAYYAAQQALLQIQNNVKQQEFDQQIDQLADFNSETLKEEVEHQKAIDKRYSQKLESQRAYEAASALLTMKSEYDSKTKNARQAEVWAGPAAAQQTTYDAVNRKATESMSGVSGPDRQLADSLYAADVTAQKAAKELRDLIKANQGNTVETDRYAAALANVNSQLATQKQQIEDDWNAQQKLNASWEYGATNALNKYLEATKNVAAQTEQLMTNAFKGMEDALVQFVKTGKLDFSSLVDTILTEMIRIEVRQGMASAAGGGGLLGSLFSWLGIGGSSSLPAGSGIAGPGQEYAAAGGVYQSASLHAYANTVQTTPQPFTYASGGVFAEAGPEAVMPLTRNSAGKLGVAASGGGVVINITESPGNGGQVTQSQSGGVNVIDIIVERVKGAVGADIGNGGNLANLIQRRYGLSPAMGAVR